MIRIRAAGFGVSLDGFGAGAERSLQDPLGKNGAGTHYPASAERAVTVTMEPDAEAG